MSENEERISPNGPPRADDRPIEDPGSQALADALSSSFRLIRVLIVLLTVAIVFSGVFIVDPNQVAVVLRFGQPVGEGSERILQPGVHWSFPYPIDERVTIAVGESRTIEATNCWYLVTPEMLASGTPPDAQATLQPNADGYALTSEGNIIHARAVAKYRIADPLRYSFHYRNADTILENALNNAVIRTAGSYTADAALYRDKTGFQETVRRQFLATVRKAELGIDLETLEVQTFPPMFVKEAFDQVLVAEQTLSQTVNQARGESEELTRKAVGEAKALVNEGITRSNALVQSARADAQFFTDQLTHYRRNPQLYRVRRLLETMSEMMTNVNDLWLFPDAQAGQRRELRLLINREPKEYTGASEDQEQD